MLRSSTLLKKWGDFSVAKKIYLVIGTMAVLIACELVILSLALHTLSAVRAFVEGEGSWSKAQKDAAFSLQRYASTGDEAAFQDFLRQLSIPEGDHQARIEMSKGAGFDRAVVRDGFIQGRIHPDDIDPMIHLLQRFSRISYISRAIEVWTEGDLVLEQFKGTAIRYHELRRQGASSARLQSELDHFAKLNARLTEIEAEFSAVLGQGSRWLEHVVVSLLFFAVLTVEAIGLTLTFRTGRALSKSLRDANEAATRIGSGDFKVRLPVHSQDELGKLAQSINRMGELLKVSYGSLEARVRARTSELEKLLAENAKLYQQAEEAVRMRDEFFSIASHELKTPITSLSLQLQLMERHLGGPTEKSREMIELCLRQSQRLALLSDELMDLTRIRIGRIELRPEVCDLSSVVRDAAVQLGTDAAKAQSELVVNAEHPVKGKFDSVRIGQVVTNLISNAIKYGNSRPIAVNVRRVASHVLIEVTDQGRGIPLEDQARIFDRFERASQSDGSVAGLGLGLYISREIVESHGGKISVRSQPGLGSTFVVELPIEVSPVTSRINSIMSRASERPDRETPAQV